MIKIKNILAGVIFLSCILLVSGCATKLSKEQVKSIKPIGIYNSFPNRPLYTIIGSTIFTNKISLTDIILKPYVAEALEKILSNKGYNVVHLKNKSQLKLSSFDMTIEIAPQQANKKIGTFGYGFYDKYTFGLRFRPHSYTAVNLIPRVKGKARGAFTAYYHENFQRLGICVFWRT